MLASRSFPQVMFQSTSTDIYWGFFSLAVVQMEHQPHGVFLNVLQYSEVPECRETDFCRDGHVSECALVLNAPFFVVALLLWNSQRGPEVCLLFCSIMFSTHFESWINGMICKHFPFFSLYTSISHLRYRPAKLALANYCGKQLSTIAALSLFGKQIDPRVEGWLVFSCHGEEFSTPV